MRYIGAALGQPRPKKVSSRPLSDGYNEEGQPRLRPLTRRWPRLRHAPMAIDSRLDPACEEWRWFGHMRLIGR
jgi:hypothetical protein